MKPMIIMSNQKIPVQGKEATYTAVSILGCKF